MRFPLRLKVGIYAAAIAAIVFLATPPTMRTFIYNRQVEELDDQLKRDAERIFDEIETRATRLSELKKPLSRDFLPQHLRLRLVRISNQGGAEIFRSTNWRGFDPATLRPGIATVVVLSDDKNRNCRVATVTKDGVTVTVGTRLGTIEGMQESLMDAFKVTLPVGIVFVFAGTILMAQRALRPIAKMTSAAERISAEHPSERLPVPDTNDEIERLSLVLNQSFDRLENAYSASERFSSAASHQLKTPLTVLRAGLSELRGCDYLQPIERETVESMLQQTRRLTTLCEDLLLLAQADAGRLDISPEPIDLVPLLRGAVDDMEVLGMDKELTVDHELPLDLVAMADTRRISIVLQNLGENAVKYNRINGRIKLTGRIEKGKVVVSVASTGPQILPENAERIFERFNRGNTGENLKGHGLGLSIARSLARAHGGELRLARSDASWTEFELILPLAPPAA